MPHESLASILHERYQERVIQMPPSPERLQQLIDLSVAAIIEPMQTDNYKNLQLPTTFVDYKPLEYILVWNFEIYCESLCKKLCEMFNIEAEIPEERRFTIDRVFLPGGILVRFLF